MERPLRRPPSPASVLLVDGQEDTLALYAVALSATGFDVIAAKDGPEAFSRARAVRPDIIVTQLVLRQMTGWALIARLKAEPTTRDIPVVVLTDDDQLAVRQRARRAGCIALVVTPCLPDRLAVGLRALRDRYCWNEPTPIAS